jgi:hypothetical protein
VALGRGAVVAATGSGGLVGPFALLAGGASGLERRPGVGDAPAAYLTGGLREPPVLRRVE